LTSREGSPCGELDVKIVKQVYNKINKRHTTLAARANTSRSEGTEVRVASTEAISDGERRAISLLHSVPSDRKIAREMSKELGATIRYLRKKIVDQAYARERIFPAFALWHSALSRFSKSALILDNLPG
jgi:hypothetical protein